jgi:hypothetical protein
MCTYNPTFFKCSCLFADITSAHLRHIASIGESWSLCTVYVFFQISCFVLVLALPALCGFTVFGQAFDVGLYTGKIQRCETHQGRESCYRLAWGQHLRARRAASAACAAVASSNHHRGVMSCCTEHVNIPAFHSVFGYPVCLLGKG